MRWASSSGEWLYVRLSVSLVCQLDGLSSLGFTAGVRLPYEWLYIMSPELLLVPFVGMACLNDLHRGLERESGRCAQACGLVAATRICGLLGWCVR